MTLPQHMSLTQEHYTPAEIVEAAREVLEWISLDPASCPEANATVNAGKIFTREDDGLAQPWFGRVFLNPPGGTFTSRRKSKDDPPVETSPADAAARTRWKTDSRAVAWWRKLIHEQSKDPPEDVTAAIFVGFSLEILQSAQAPGWVSPLQFPICVPRERLCFGGKDPTHANVIVYTGPMVDQFVRVFSRFGDVRA